MRKLISIAILLLAVVGIITLFFVLRISHAMHPRPLPVADCAYRAIPMAVDDGSPMTVSTDAAEAPLTPADRFAAELQGDMSARAADLQKANGAAAAPQFLVLSGGSQHGAFGAGYFAAMPSIPTYDIVTGVSTGSLQSTMLFLANQPIPKDRSYGWVDGPLASIYKPGVSNAHDLALAYSIDKEGDIITPEPGGIVGGLTKGAMATFAPLLARLKAIISFDTMRQIKAEAAKHRKLYVGTVNLDDGKGYAIDLTDLASRIDTPAWKGKEATLQDCYVQALAASSSVPPSAFPVSLTIADGQKTRTDMYMDGGGRFGVFLSQILRALGEKAPKDAKVTLIVNGVLYAPPWLQDGKPVETWSSLSAAARAVQMLETQVYIFSAASASQFGVAHGGLDMAYISNQGLPPGSVQPDDFVFRGKTCSAWSAIDAQAKVLEFHPNYMGCLAQYGASRGAAAAWNRQVVTPAGTTP